MQTRLRFGPLACAAILLATIAFAQVTSEEPPADPLSALGTSFTYQGRLTDAGDPATGSYDLQLRLFDALAGGAQVGGTVVKDDVAVADGLFTVELDFGASVFTGQALWLELGVRPGASSGAFSVLSPPQPLNPAPFAHYSKAGVATDVQCAGCVSVADLAAGATSSGQVLVATGASTIDWQSPAWPTGTGSAGQVAFWTGANVLGGSASLVWDSANGRLGIGSATPQDSLEVAGNLRLPVTGSSSTGVVKLGSNRFLHAYGDHNTFAGVNAGNFTLGGTPGQGAFNTGLGEAALAIIATGQANTAVGYASLHADSSGSHNTAVGTGSLGSNTTANQNTAVGNIALTENVTGSWNTAVGNAALRQNTAGDENTAVGEEALFGNTTSGQNTAVGRYALSTQSFDNGGVPYAPANTAVGYQALRFNQPTSLFDGNDNTALGSEALRGNTSGYANTSVGSSSLNSNTAASLNTAVGSQALYHQSFDNGGVSYQTANTAVGYVALYSNNPTTINNGAWNTAVGLASLYDNTTGKDNTAVGRQSLYANTIGTDNVAVGGEALFYNTTSGRNTAVGRYALNTQSYDNGGTAWDANNTAIGFYALYSNQPTSTTVGRRNTAVGGAAGDSKTVTNSTFLGYDSDATVDLLTNVMALGYGARVDASNKVRIGNSSVTVIEGQVDWSFPSDIRHKRDVIDLDLGLDFVLRLRPVQYRLIDGNGRLDMGFIAQDIEALLGGAYNVVGAGEDDDRTLSLRRGDLIAPLVKAVQEQQEEIGAKNEEIARLTRKVESEGKLIDELVRRVEALEGALGQQERR